MKKTWRSFSAYQGAGWQARTESMPAELAKLDAPRQNSEYRRLREVLLCVPGRELLGVRDPNAVQHLARIDLKALRREYAALKAAFRREGVMVRLLGGRRQRLGRGPAYNLMYVRDLFFNTMEGAVVARMASLVRAGEELLAVPALAELGVPVNKTVSGEGLFEGADALWLDPGTVLCGVGNRTNEEGFRQLRLVLAAQGVETIKVPMPGGVQHLLGLLQIVDKDLALLRVEKAPAALRRLLRSRGVDTVPVREGDEVRRQGMNVVTVAPRRVIMPSGCPGLKKLYLSAGLAVAAEVEIGQLINGGGGIACATGIISRSV